MARAGGISNEGKRLWRYLRSKARRPHAARRIVTLFVDTHTMKTKHRIKHTYNKFHTTRVLYI